MCSVIAYLSFVGNRSKSPHGSILELAGEDVKSAGGGQRVHLNEPRDLASGVGERIGEAEREGMKDWPEAGRC
jgi:hypothetical protein